MQLAEWYYLTLLLVVEDGSFWLEGCHYPAGVKCLTGLFPRPLKTGRTAEPALDFELEDLSHPRWWRLLMPLSSGH